MKSGRTQLRALAAAVWAASSFSCQSPDQAREAANTAAPAGSNPVQIEMRLLHAALRDGVTAVANGKVDTIPASIHQVHAAKQATAAALRAGSYKPPKNGERLARFGELDEAFHADLEKLVSAAKNDDVPATGRALGQVLSSCQGCHREYRF